MAAIIAAPRRGSTLAGRPKAAAGVLAHSRVIFGAFDHAFCLQGVCRASAARAIGNDFPGRRKRGRDRRQRQADEPDYKRTEDVIYGRKFGTALTMDVFQPPKPNGAAVIFCVSGGWFSAHESVNTAFAAELLKRGYTVFEVVHGSQPKFTIPEVLQDMHRAVR